ncbi:MAG: type II toxin-antitoxin system YafQ family toxin [Firmicutes bacterium]|nr:type II toxin-antitoxin system YafQ family toxin [Bacillota bacterium]
MLKLTVTGKFKKDYKVIKKRGYDLSLLAEVLDRLINEEPLDTKHHDHPLTGNYTGFRECHIQPDWLLIYKIQENTAILVASRTGTHSDLF